MGSLELTREPAAPGNSSTNQAPGKTAAPSPFSLDKPLLQLSRVDQWTIRDACEGVQIFGALGSGKTSGSGQAIALAYLRAGFGGIVLTAKPDERALWENYCRIAGRSDDLLIFSPSQPWRFNFLDYEMTRSGPGAGDTLNLVQLFYTVLSTVEGESGANGDPFWERTVKQMLRNALDLLKGAGAAISLSAIHEVISSAPTDPDLLDDDEWVAKSRCCQLVEDGDPKVKGTDFEYDFEMASRYWLREFPQLSEKTRSIIVTSFTSMADSLMRGKLRNLYCTTTNIWPEQTHEGKIILLDLPIKEYNEVGQYAQVVFKYLWQGATERRDVNVNPRPVFLWADEAQFFIAKEDQLFQTTARSSRACTVLLTQNLPNYFAKFSGDRGRANIDSLMGNLQTKIFHANGDPSTNEWASKIFGQSWQNRSSMTMSNGGNSDGGSISMSKSFDHEVPAQEFTRLRKGGPQNSLQVDAIIFQGGRTWQATGKNWIRATFGQQ